MQQMDSSERNSHYGQYEGSQYNEAIGDGPGQKLRIEEDEQFADLLVRRLKQELKEEIKPRAKFAPGFGVLALAAMVLAFGLLALALILGVDGWGIAGLMFCFIVMCGVLVPIAGINQNH